MNAFAYRPAPVQVSWLGYFASTGLSTIDAVLLDNDHAPAGAQDHFTSRLILKWHTYNDDQLKQDTLTVISKC